MASDIYTIGRTLVVLAMEFRGYQSTYVASLPPVSETPLFQQHDSLYRLLAKACAPDPADRFASADELRVQLLGVLREVVAAQDAGRRARPSTRRPRCCSSPRAVTDEPLDWGHLPALRVDDGDPQAGWLRTVSVDDPGARLRRCCSGAAVDRRGAAGHRRGPRSRPGAPTWSTAAVRDMLGDDPWEWRAVWLSGLAALATDDAAGAQAAFNAVYGQVPGELAPKLALALACETSGELDVAEALYATCARTDANYIAPPRSGWPGSAPLAATSTARSPPLDLVPPTSRALPSARRRRAGLLADSGRGLPALAEAMGSIESLTIEPRERASLAVDVLQAALTQVLADGPEPDISIAGTPRGGAGPARRPRGRLPRPGRPRPHPQRARGPGRPRQRRTTMESSMSTCPSCSTSVSDQERFCEACGADLAPATASALRRRRVRPRGRGTRAPATRPAPPPRWRSP